MRVTDTIYRRSYMSAHVLLNLLNELGKRDKIRGLLKLNIFNKTVAHMLDSIYHMTLKILNNHIFGVQNFKILPSFTQRYNGRHNVTN